MKSLKRLAVLALLAGAANATNADISERQPLQPLDLFDLNWVSGPQISPDGRQVAYTRTGFDIMADRRRSSLWLINTDGSGHEPLTSAGASGSSARWSPDGSRLAYVSNADGSSQIHVRWMESGRDVAVTHLQQGPRSLTWSPDGNYIAFMQFVPDKAKPIATMPAAPKGAKWNDAPRVFEDPYWRSDSGGFLKPGFAQIFVVASTGGKPIQLTDAPYPHGGSLSWSADGEYLYFNANHDENWQTERQKQDLYRVHVATRTTEQLTDTDLPEYSPRVSPDGKSLVFMRSEQTGRYQNPNVYRVPIAADGSLGDEERVLRTDRPTGNLTWAANSRSLYFTYVDEGVSKLGRTTFNGKWDTLATGLGGTAIGRPYSSASFTVANNGTVAHDVSESEQPANLAITRGSRTTQITNLNRDLLALREVPDVEEIWYESSHDGLRIQGWIIKPPGFDPSKQYPLILEIHGGPHTAYGDFFSAELQLMAAAGYVVLYTNPRGSTSYGEDFALEIYQDYPGHDYDDLMSGVDAVIEQGYVDPDQLYVTGGSGGGILTAWIVTRTERFKAAVSQKPVINWFTHTLTADIGPFFWSNWFAAEPWADVDAYMAKSPITFVDKVTTPTMLLTGEVDWRTPMSESEQFFQALHMTGVDTALVRIQNASHSIAARPSNLIAKVTYILGWFDRYRTENDEEGADSAD